jgi:spore maturation protein CgeB
VLNVNRDSMARFGFSPPTRVFEAAGAGACLVTDAWDGLEQFLEPGREVLMARDANDVVQTLLRLGEPTARAIGRAARRRVLAEHTYEHRAHQFEDVIRGHGLSGVAA